MTVRWVFGIASLLIVAACSSNEPIATSSAPNPVETTTATPAAVTSTTSSWEPTSNIEIRGGEFYETDSGERFVPRGTNLVFLRGLNQLDTPIAPVVWDPAWMEARLSELSDLGYNTVRIMWDLCEFCSTESNGRLLPGLLDNAATTLEMAAEHGIYVWYTSNDLPGDSWYARQAFEEGEADFLTTKNVEIYRQYYTDFLQGLIDREARTDRIFTIDIRNEYVYQLNWLEPWTLTEGLFTAANGQSYDMSNEAERIALSADGIRYWADEMTSVVKSHLPDVLVTMTTLTPNDRVMERGIEDPRWVHVGDFFEESRIDFLNIHGAAEEPEELLWEYVMDETSKPVVSGEYGLWRGHGSADAAAFWMTFWQSESCQQGFDGWLMWHWMGDDGYFPGRTPVVSEAVAPANNPDPCELVEIDVDYWSFNATVTASATEASPNDDYQPRNVIDQVEDTWWSAGAGAPQNITIDLGSPGPVGRVVMPIGFLTPEGPAKIEIWGWGPEADGPEQLLGTIQANLSPGIEVEASWEPVPDIRFVRLDIVEMQDWVIIHDVEVWDE